MPGGEIRFAGGLAPASPADTSVLIIGQLKHLSSLDWDLIATKFGGTVTKDVWEKAVSGLSPAPVDSVQLYLNRITLAALPTKVSRHNTPSRAQFIARIIKASKQPQSIVLVCEPDDVYASGCAVGRCYPLFTRKTESQTSAPKQPKSAEIRVEFLLVEGSRVIPSRLDDPTLRLLETSCSAIQLTASITDTPANEMNTDTFVAEVRRIGEEVGAACTIIRGEQLREQGFGGLYGVGKAAEHPPALAVLSHTPPDAKRTVAWVGKGITFDTGGLSIKSKTGMLGMKMDCGGAAAVLGAFYVAVRNGFTDNLHAVMCLAENSVGPKATRPDDIHTLYSGKTVEINNTDAEGRLVLADGVAYAAKDLGADIILDICTLTGAQGAATGRHHAAHLANSGAWEAALSEAGRNSGDLTFPLVYCPEFHFQEFNSTVADMKNSVADRGNALASCAGLFIQANLGFDFPGTWLHVDMASPSHSGERATGYGVALLNTLFGESSENSMLRRIAPTMEAEPNGCDGQENQRKKLKV